MVIDILMIGSLIGYAVHRGHRSPGETFSELIWIILGVACAVFLYRPTAAVLQLDHAIGDGLGNIFGFAVVSLVFLALRHFFVAVHHKDAVREQHEKAEDADDDDNRLHFSWLSVGIAGVSGSVTVSFALLLWSAVPASVFPGSDNALSGSVLTRAVIEIAQPLSPALDDLVVTAWEDSESLLGSGIAGATTESGRSNFTLAPDEEVLMLAAVNQVRLDHKLRPLELDSSLTSLARDHGMDMAANNFFAHTSPTRGDLRRRISVAGVEFGAAGENLAKAQSVHQAMTELMLSDGHRENLLRPDYTHIGIGAIVGETAVHYYVQEFAN